MPEGHTLHRIARALRATFVGQVVEVTSPQGRFAGAALVDGRVLDDVAAHGKHLFAAFGDRIVHVHLGLFGRHVIGEGDPPLPRGAVRMRWVTATGWADLRGPTACEVLDPPEVDAILARLGPDPLRAGADGERAYRRIARSRAPIAGLLMDQAVLAGVGNVYRAEILYRHRVDPYLPGRDLAASRWQPLWMDLVTLMRAGLRSGRIVTTDPADRSRRGGRVLAEDAFYVYRRTGQPCRVCGTPVQMQVLAARKLYWCPTCQVS
jgi:formamidopyrimidine-DNA glycosylase